MDSSISEIEFKRVKIVSEYNQEIPQSQTADNPMAPRGRAAKSVLSISFQSLKTVEKYFRSP